MRKVKSCGFIVMRTQPKLSFLLLMKHSSRYDLPKGHIEVGENDLSCAFRELYEETGIAASTLHLDQTFRFTTIYQTYEQRFGQEIVEKTLVIFWGWLKQDVKLQLSEHDAYMWVEWNPPHAIQKKTVDPLLAELEQYFYRNEITL
ncbi:NUDIX domain-containing protein [Microcoleus sp. FACHB-53]|nr:NUDIX domain-containing protein [Microcoleus sp. FACHB-53]